MVQNCSSWSNLVQYWLKLVQIHLNFVCFLHFRQTYCQGGRHFYGMWQNDWRLRNFHIRSLEMDWNQNCRTGYTGFRQQPSGRPGEFPFPSILQKSRKVLTFSEWDNFCNFQVQKSCQITEWSCWKTLWKAIWDLFMKTTLHSDLTRFLKVGNY